MNTFGQAYVQGSRSEAMFPLVDPRCVRESRARFRRDLFPELYYANSYYSLAGRWPDVGWLLLDRASYNQLDPYSNTLQLKISDFVNDTVTISNISIVQARCVSTGLVDDESAIYLLQVTNNQGILHNQWFQYPTNSQYNVRAPAYDGNYYSGSLTGANKTDAWTWDGMVGDLWDQATALLGTYPHLPITPDGAPEGFSFVGVPLWEAISHVMDHLGLNVVGQYPSFSIVVLGATDNSYQELVDRYDRYLEDSMEYLDKGSGRVPKQVVVYFHRRNRHYGVEETVRYDAGTSLQWQNIPAYSVTVQAPAAFSSALGTGHLWADFTVRYDQNSLPLAADVTAAQAIANQRARQYYNLIYRGDSGFMRKVYTGALPFTTGSLVDGVRWFNTGMHGMLDEKWCGWRTETIRGYAWEEVTFLPTARGITGTGPVV